MVLGVLIGMDEVERLRRRGDEWFAEWVRATGAEFRAVVVAEELASVLERYASRDDIGHEAGVVDALSNFVSLMIARDAAIANEGRTCGGVFNHPKDLG